MCPRRWRGRGSRCRTGGSSVLSDGSGPQGRGAGQGKKDGAGAPEPTGVDLARVALRAAKARAKERGDQAGQRRQARRGGGLRSGARPGGRDPLLLGAAVERLRVERGWEVPLAVGGVMGRWPELVGPEIAAHCEPLSFDEAERVLAVRCDSTAWATQLRWMAPQVVRKLNADVGQGSVRLIKVLGPGGPPRSGGAGGRLRAPGSRGPGDTYG
ncbi:DUF721 domain-containing protein [Streptomyces xiamenensis]|uniref:DUF721 domain-containing protein n=1 Tax=Streptomyces xiamenensis TaxID=408015 RepID=UPI0036AE080A